MSTLKLAVLRQVAYAHSVRDFIREILKKLIPGKWINRVFADSDEAFNNKLDEAFKKMDVATATKDDYRKAVAEVLCDEVSRLCGVLKDVCDGRGYLDYYEAHISHERFVRLVLSTDTMKLGKMKKLVADASLSPIDMLRGVGAVLNDEPLEERAALCARERRRANADLKAIAADVKSTMQIGMDEIKSGVAAVGAKVDAAQVTMAKIGRARQKTRSCKTHSQRKIDAVQTAWTVYLESATARTSVNTRPTNRGAFEYSKRQLELAGVTTLKEFCEIKHSLRTREYRTRLKSLYAAQRQSPAQAIKQSNNQTGKYGIIRGMGKNAKHIAPFALAIACALAAPLRTDASLVAMGGGGQKPRLAA